MAAVFSRITGDARVSARQTSGGAASTPNAGTSTRARVGSRAPARRDDWTRAARQRDWPRAEGAFREAVAREPGSVEAHMALGNFHATRGDAPRAEAALRTAAELAPISSPARLRLAEFLGQTGRGEEGKRLLATTAHKAPDYPPAWRRMAEQGRC